MAQIAASHNPDASITLREAGCIPPVDRLERPHYIAAVIREML
jgi:hypothetical protein